MRFVYIAGPYGDKSGYAAIDRNIQEARRHAVAVSLMGCGYYCPHLNSAHFEVDCPEIPVEHWYEMDLRFLGSCDVMLLLPGWEKSIGTLAELEEWKLIADGPVFKSLNELMDWLNENPE